ncbi:MAG: hypothetical protein IJE14_09270 [Clostridia bacterium]|nr:hypothetical protein [Clostridia bacterium]
MKKLSIVLALIMALSCFSLTAFAADESTTEAAATTEAAKAAKVTINVVLIDLEGTEAAPIVLKYDAVPGAKLTAADILAAVKSRRDDQGNALIDTEKYVIAEEVIAYDNAMADGKDKDPYAFKETKVVSGASYEFKVVAYEIDQVKALSNTIGEQLAKIDWKGIVGANVTLINQLINASKAAIDSLVNAEWPDAAKKDETTTAETTTAATVETPDTGVSAVAGAAVVVLALSATTAVVLRKKED